MAKDLKVLEVDDDGLVSVVFPSSLAVTDTSFNLIQRIVKRILTLEGSDPIHPTIGTDIPALFRSLSANNKDKISGIFPIYIKDIERELIREQTALSNLADHEKLQSLTLIDFYIDENNLAWYLKIRVNLEDGTSQNIII